jgi:type VI secretion system protein ImpJ
MDVFGRKGLSDAGLPRYDHLKLESCFLSARRLINQLLNEIAVGPEFLAIMQPKEDYLATTLPAELFSKRNRFYLLIQASGKSSDIKELFSQNARLAAPSELPAMIDHALPGIELIELKTAPQGLPRRPNSNLYRIEQLSAEWELVEKEGELALFWPEGPENLKAEIVVLRG